MKNKAFTLIEVILYTAIFAIVGGLATGILLTVTQVQQRESASAEVTGQLNFVIQTVQRLVRESSNIEIEAGIATSTLKLRMQDPAKDPTCISLVGGVIKLAEGPDAVNPNNCTTDTSDLTNDRVTVDTLDFKKFIQYPGHDTVSINLAMTYSSTNPKSQVQRSLSSAIARVSAATFDSNVLPGNASFSLGQSGSAWQNVFIGDGSAGSPSYSFGGDNNMGIFRAGTDILGFSTAGSERVRIDANGNIGIGTVSPGAKLHISSGNASWLRTESIDVDSNAGFQIKNDARQWQIQIDGSDADKFKIRDSTASAYRLTIDIDGNVGIGTASPNTVLDINGALSIRGMSAPAVSPAGEGRIYFDSTANKFKISENGGSYSDLGGTSSFYLYGDVHTNLECEAAGAYLVRSIGGGDYLCQVTGTSCPSEWTKRLNWSVTDPKYCYAACQSCTTGSHAWSNTTAETCTYYTSGTKYGCSGAGTCTASIKSVGCY